MSKDWCKSPPGDFDCYRRAESIPSGPNCVIGTRQTYLADGEDVPYADGAAETAAALGLAAAVFSDDKAFSDRCTLDARSLHNFATRFPSTAADKVWVVNNTYATTYPQTNLLWASAALAYVYSCGGSGTSGSDRICNEKLAQEFLDKAWGWWADSSVRASDAVAVCVYLLAGCLRLLLVLAQAWAWSAPSGRSLLSFIVGLMHRSHWMLAARRPVVLCSDCLQTCQ